MNGVRIPITVVTDAFGNWEIAWETFTNKSRQLTVQFPTIHIYNDGDPGSYGEEEFLFRRFSTFIFWSRSADCWPGVDSRRC
jgi:hypothetical protein